MPEKRLWEVEVLINGTKAGSLEIFAETGEQAEDIASESIILNGKKAYQKGQAHEEAEAAAKVPEPSAE